MQSVDVILRQDYIEKGTALKKCMIRNIFQCSDAFRDESSTADHVATAGEKLLLCYMVGNMKTTSTY